MAIEHGPIIPVLPRLADHPAPLLDTQALLAVATVELTAGDVPLGALRDFYERTLGLDYVSHVEDVFTFKLAHRRIRLRHSPPLEADLAVPPISPGRVALAIRDFSAALRHLASRRIAYELIHLDTGLSRVALTRDPAGNHVHLFETRPF